MFARHGSREDGSVPPSADVGHSVTAGEVDSPLLIILQRVQEFASAPDRIVPLIAVEMEEYRSLGHEDRLTSRNRLVLFGTSAPKPEAWHRKVDNPEWRGCKRPPRASHYTDRTLSR